MGLVSLPASLLGVVVTVGVGVFVALLGLCAMLLRRTLAGVVMGGMLCALGNAVALGGLAVLHGDARAAALAVLLLVSGATWSVMGAALAIAMFRRRGTPYVDELRELRG